MPIAELAGPDPGSGRFRFADAVMTDARHEGLAAPVEHDARPVVWRPSGAGQVGESSYVMHLDITGVLADVRDRGRKMSTTDRTLGTAYSHHGLTAFKQNARLTG